MRVVVVGAGAWGLPTAAELARRGHQVARLERLAGTTVHLRRGLLWRDDDAGVGEVHAALAGEHVRHDVVEPGEVGRLLPGLRPDGRPAVWCEVAGPVLAAASMRAQLGLFEAAGGTLEQVRVERVEPVAGGVRVDLEGGGRRDADV